MGLQSGIVVYNQHVRISPACSDAVHAVGRLLAPEVPLSIHIPFHTCQPLDLFFSEEGTDARKIPEWAGGFLSFVNKTRLDKVWRPWSWPASYASEPRLAPARNILPLVEIE